MEAQREEEKQDCVRNEDILASYTRAFSSIEGMQREHLVRYTLRRSEEGLLLEVYDTAGPTVRRVRLFCTEHTARGLLQYLYENAVAAVHCADAAADAAADVCGAG